MAGGIVLVFLLVVGGFGVVIWALVDAVKVPDDSMYQSGSKLVWVLVILLAGFIGAIIYLAVGRPSKAASPSAPGIAPGSQLPPPPPAG